MSLVVYIYQWTAIEAKKKEKFKQEREKEKEKNKRNKTWQGDEANSRRNGEKAKK